MCCLKGLLLFSSPIRVRLQASFSSFIPEKFPTFKNGAVCSPQNRLGRGPTAAVVVRLDDL